MSNCEFDILKGKIFLNVSKWGYMESSAGGGEEFLLQNMQTMYEYGMKCYWLCFSNANNKNFDNFYVSTYYFGTIIHISNGFNEKILIDWLKLIKPNIVNHQGFLREEIYNCCKKLRIEMLTGFHFWSGAIILDTVKKNIDILKNYKFHQTDPSLLNLYGKKYCNMYTVSPFVSECIKKITNCDIDYNIYASSNKKKCLIDYSQPNIFGNQNENNKYVTLINVHTLKGGDIFLKLIEECPNIPFLGIKTEQHSKDLDDKIKFAIDNRNLSNAIKCHYLERITDVKTIYQLTKILLIPSYVDETFCRVANEGMMNGIPIITSGQGYLTELTNNSAIIIKPEENINVWINNVSSLYFNEKKIKEMSIQTRNAYEKHSEEKAKSMLVNKVSQIITQSKNMNIMFFTVYGDQGLGIQTRNYYNILKDHFNVHIFSYKPYINKGNNLQKDINEWSIEHIYYSENIREKVTDTELLDFIKRYNIGKCIIPETCWFRIFEIAKLMKKNNVLCYAIPNIEIVRKSEVQKHKYFYKILCNNNLCLNIFKNFGFNNLKYIGYSIPNKQKYIAINNNLETINFLLIGGLNGISRKHLLETCDAFIKAHEINKNIHLTCTVLEFNNLEIEHVEKINKFKQESCITFIYEHLTYKKIEELYEKTHIVVQVSKHEGLGLGFYESLHHQKPVITLNAAPHNEIINDTNGWLIDCKYKDISENNEALIKAAYFDVDVLTIKINEIVYEINKNKNYYLEKINTLVMNNEKYNNIDNFKKRFIESLNN